MLDTSAWPTYAEQLAGRGYGFPLWHPELSQFGTGITYEVEIGDVGFVSEGSDDCSTLCVRAVVLSTLTRYSTATAAVACYEDFHSVFPPDNHPDGLKKGNVMKKMLSRGIDVRLGKHGVTFVCVNDDIRKTPHKDAHKEDIDIIY
ncbi:uncharacterized protein PHACADRAFT_207500 [Phanerochaete carnosa HHB-10118-sp]|uniref:Uncharacterized protein n=1 Tax=Phanerochaete carnosa (strain HHB-10118-sp) TaxID=650164 RepID=K5X781_PHACS|nr:uncharacterized protein PHACADRAFT_207500 [Phanerochaete carnosa HHB-10118-sp]EKM58727.1 hypothetical protein PHACADRAFT_207500 [Phanerochaete carnosa HHB-10118-sp]